MEIKDMTAVQLSAAIKEGKITVSDAVEASLAAVRASEDAIHAFLLVDEEGARARAAEVQKKIDAGELHIIRLLPVVHLLTHVQILIPRKRGSIHCIIGRSSMKKLHGSSNSAAA